MNNKFTVSPYLVTADKYSQQDLEKRFTQNDNMKSELKVVLNGRSRTSGEHVSDRSHDLLGTEAIREFDGALLDKEISANKDAYGDIVHNYEYTITKIVQNLQTVESSDERISLLLQAYLISLGTKGLKDWFRLSQSAEINHYVTSIVTSLTNEGYVSKEGKNIVKRVEVISTLKSFIKDATDNKQYYTGLILAIAGTIVDPEHKEDWKKLEGLMEGQILEMLPNKQGEVSEMNLENDIQQAVSGM